MSVSRSALVRRVLLLAGAGLCGVLVQCNVAWWPTPRETFMKRVDQSVRLATDWIVLPPEDTTSDAWNNAILFYMVADMADLSGDQRLRQISTSLLDSPRFAGSVW